MTHQEDFRSRSQNVRNSARLHLLDIRQARIAKRGLRFRLVAADAGASAIPGAAPVAEVAKIPEVAMVAMPVAEDITPPVAQVLAEPVATVAVFAAPRAQDHWQRVWSWQNSP